MEGRSYQGAYFSEDREYRYQLWRTWDLRKPVLAFVMLNPSTADEAKLDPTCRRCKGYAEQWGYGTLLVGNIFALRSTDPDNLYEHDAPVGPENNEHLQDIAEEADKIIAAWGHHGDYMNRGEEVLNLLNQDVHALDMTQNGQPVHPLYQPKDIEPILVGGVSQ